MKKAILLITIGFLSNYVYSQSVKNTEKLNLSVLFNYTTPKQEKIDFATVVRVTYPVRKKVFIGTEINYLMRYGKDGNQDYAGGVLFGRINPYLGFTCEIGYSYNKLVSGRRREVITKGLFTSFGYEAKINNHWSIDLQYRVLPAKYLDNNVPNSKVYVLGASYRFLKK